MAAEIPFVEPAAFSVGERVQWKRTLDDFPISEGWTLKYYLRGNFAHDPITLTATTSGTDYLIDITTDLTSAYPAGVYFWNAFVEKTGYRMPVDSGRFIVTPDLSTLPTNQPYDGRSHARRCLEAIEAVLEGRSTHDQLKYALQAVGRSVEKMPIADVLKLRDYYLTEVQAEDAALRPGKKNIYIRFGDPA
jgi:hypothetical protein